MPRLEPRVGPPAASFVTSLIATVGGMILIFGPPGICPTPGIGGSLSRTTPGYFFAIGIIALPLLIMLGSFLWLAIAIFLLSRPVR